MPIVAIGMHESRAKMRRTRASSTRRCARRGYAFLSLRSEIHCEWIKCGGRNGKANGAEDAAERQPEAVHITITIAVPVRRGRRGCVEGLGDGGGRLQTRGSQQDGACGVNATEALTIVSSFFSHCEKVGAVSNRQRTKAGSRQDETRGFRWK